MTNSAKSVLNFFMCCWRRCKSDFILENFEIIRKIGSGSFGEKYLANEIQTGKQYVTKVCIQECITKENLKRNQHLLKSKNPAVLSF